MSTISNDTRIFIARAGIATAGIVYCLLGILTLMAIHTGRSQESNKNGVMDFIAEQPFGKLLLILTGLGLLAYSLWKLYRAIEGPSGRDSNKDLVKRAAYAIGGLLYLFVSSQAFIKAFAIHTSGGSDKQSLAEKLGASVLIIVALIFLGVAVYQFYRAYSKKYRKKVKEADMSSTSRKIMLKAGMIGYTARGVVITIISYLIFRAALSGGSENVGGTDQAFEFIQQSLGQVLMAIVALGFVAYGVFMLLKSKYRDMTGV